ncbi:MAG TPA: hypothetical protein VLM40_15045, partial [Gemmata sp.]|nr:hypothetical protein [Gemmata sp.]
MTDEHTPKRDETPTSAPEQPGVEEAAPPLPGTPIDITPESLPPALAATPTYEVAETPVAAPAEAVEESEPAAAPEPPLRDAAHPVTIEEPSVPPP